MRRKTIKRVKAELVRRGATYEQASRYIYLLKVFEKESQGAGQRHHVMPRGIKRWKRYEKCEWNFIKITWPLHLALHSYLMQVYPKDEQLIKAVRATAVSLKVVSRKKIENQETVMRMYHDRKSPQTIAKKIGVSAGTIKNWLVSWDIKMRDSSESKFHPSREKFKKDVIGMYKEGNSSLKIGFRFEITPLTVLRWLSCWGVKLRPRLESLQLNPKKKHKTEIIALYKEGKSIVWLSRKFGINWETTKRWLLYWGVNLRSAREATQVYHRGQTCRSST